MHVAIFIPFCFNFSLIRYIIGRISKAYEKVLHNENVYLFISAIIVEILL